MRSWGYTVAAAMQEYYEELWRRLPEDVELPDFRRRLRFLMSEVRAEDRALDVGCGSGDFTAELARVTRLALGVDVAEAALSRARARHPAVEFQLVPVDGPLRLADNSFDLVWASEIIEHLADTARWLSEIRRVLAPGGRMLVTTPSHGRLRLAMGGIERYSDPLGDHLHLYTRASLGSLLREFGFAQVSVRAVGGPPLVRRMLLARGVR